MSVQEIFEVLEELSENTGFGSFEEVTSFSTYEMEKRALAYMSTWEADIYAEKLDDIKNRLVAAFSNLSPEEITDFRHNHLCRNLGLRHVILPNLMYRDALFYEQRVIIAKVCGYAHDTIRKILEKKIEELKFATVAQPNLDRMKKSGQLKIDNSLTFPDTFFLWQLQELQDFYERNPISQKIKATSIFILENLLDLFDDRVVDEKFVAQLLDYSRYNYQHLFNNEIVEKQFVAPYYSRYIKGDLEAINNAFASLIQEHNELEIIEKVTRIWNKLLPEKSLWRLRRLLLEANNSQVKKNAKHALFLIGEGKVGDTYNIIGNTQTIVNINSVLEHTSQRIAHSSIDQTTKDELEKLIERLNEELKQVPEQQAEEAETVAEYTKELVEKTTQEKPNKTSIKITVEGLLKAAENIGKIAPKVIAIAQQIVALLVS